MYDILLQLFLLSLIFNFSIHFNSFIIFCLRGSIQIWMQVWAVTGVCGIMLITVQRDLVQLRHSVFLYLSYKFLILSNYVHTVLQCVALLSGRAASYLADDCYVVTNTHKIRLRSAETLMLLISRTPTNFRNRAYCVAKPQIWNNLVNRPRAAGLVIQSLKTYSDSGTL